MVITIGRTFALTLAVQYITWATDDRVQICVRLWSRPPHRLSATAPRTHLDARDRAVAEREQVRATPSQRPIDTVPAGHQIGGHRELGHPSLPTRYLPPSLLDLRLSQGGASGASPVSWQARKWPDYLVYSGPADPHALGDRCSRKSLCRKGLDSLSRLVHGPP